MLKRTLFTLLLTALAFTSAQEEETPYVPVRLIEETAEHRLIEHSLGQTEVPLNPQRIVAIYWQITDNLLAMGVTFVGAIVYDAPYLEPYRGSFTKLPSTIDLEAILTLEPDLILVGLSSGAFWGSPESREQLERIAPLVALDDHPEHERREWTRDLGVVLGMEAEAEARLAAYRARVEQTREAVQEAIGDETVAFFNVRQRQFRLYGDEGYAAVLYRHGLDLNPPEVVRELLLGKANQDVSLEIIPRLADADHIFLMAFDDAGETLTELETSTLWQNLPAVQAGNVYRVRPINWLASSLLANEQKLRDVRAALVGDAE